MILVTGHFQVAPETIETLRPAAAGPGTERSRGHGRHGALVRNGCVEESADGNDSEPSGHRRRPECAGAAAFRTERTVAAHSPGRRGPLRHPHGGAGPGGGAARPFTGAEFLESLRDEREVYIYGERVKDVKVTLRLTDSPACLVADEHDLGMNLSRILKAAGQSAPMSKPILEINQPSCGAAFEVRREELRRLGCGAVRSGLAG